MKFTKDVSFCIKYEQDENVLKINRSLSKEKGFLGKIKRHKFITSMVFTGILLISTDIILINHFINILKQF